MFAQRIVVGLVFAVATGCNTPEPQDAPAVVAQTAPASRAIFMVNGREVSVNVEVANDEAERAQGLMHRKQLAQDSGMLFIFPTEAERPFWMKNTHVSLDMIWLSSEMRVVGVKADTEPLSTQTVSPGVPSKYVIEVNAGFAKQHGIGVGVMVRFEGVDSTP